MRFPSSSSRLAGLDTLRALAIVSVMIFHLQEYLPDSLHRIAGVGWMGVDLFFVLSGYLIGGQLLRPYQNAGRCKPAEFYLRRAYRILPAYFAVLALYLAVPLWREWPGLAPAWKFVTFTENILLHYPADLAFSHAWSLCVEEHFYLILPLLVVAMMRKPATWKTGSLIAAILLLGCGLRAWLVLHVLRAPGLSGDQVQILFMKRIYYPTWTRLDGLLLGVSLAIFEIFRPQWWRTLAAYGDVLLGAGVLVTGAAMQLFHGAYPDPADAGAIIFGFPLLAVGLTLIVAAAAGRSLLRFPMPGAQLIATLAFSLYLSHKGVAHLDSVFFPSTIAGQSWRGTGLLAGSCLCFASLLYLCVERPFLLLRAQQLASPGLDLPAMQAQDDPAL